MKSTAETDHIISCKQAGWSTRRIATELGISRNTVTRIIRQYGDVKPLVQQRPSKLQATLEWLKTLAPSSLDRCCEDLCLQIKAESGLNISLSTMNRARILSRSGTQAQSLAKPNSADPRKDAPIGWQIGPYHLNTNGALTLAGIRVAMPSLQERLLVLFAKKANQLLTRKEIIAELYDRNTREHVAHKNATLIVHRLRQELAYGPLGKDVIQTVHGQGYVLVASVDPIEPAPPSTQPPPLRLSAMANYNPYYSEVHDLWPQRDPYKLSRLELLLRKSIEHDPGFEQGHVELCYLQLLQCFWGMRSSLDVRPAIQKQLLTIEQFPGKPCGWLAIKAEIQSLLLWQPRTTQRLYGTWLADTLPGGMPRYSWARHLIFSGLPQKAVQLLSQHVHNDLCQGWLNLGMAYCSLGDLAAAEEAVHQQLRIDHAMVGTRLFLAVLKASQGKAKQATRLIEDSGLLDRPFQGVQALTAYAMAQGDRSRRSHQLLDQALALIQEAIVEVGAIGYWGLAALALGRQEEALQILKLCVNHRCYSAPVLFHTPFLKPYAHTLAVRLFMEAMRHHFEEQP